MNLLAKLEKSKNFWFVFLTLIGFFLLRLPSLFEPYWYGDEGIYQVLGLGINHGRLLYKGIWDNKPPLLYMVYGFLGGDQFKVRAASLVVGALSVVIFFFLAKNIFQGQDEEKGESNKIVYAVTALFAFLFGIPLIEGNIANAENFMLLPILFAGLLVYKRNNEIKSLKYFSGFFGPGLLLGIAFLFKIVALFDFASFAVFIFIVHFGIKKIESIIEIAIPYTLGFFLPIFLTLIFFASKGALSDFIHAAFTQNVGYVGYSNTFIIPQGLLITKLLLLSIFMLFLFVKRSTINARVLFCSLWLAFSLFNSFFSGRPYTHYVLVSIAAVCLFVGVVLYERRFKIFLLAALVVSLFLLITNFSYYGKTIPYYQNYVAFMAGKKSITNYRSFFDKNTPRDYELADYLNLHLGKNDTIFIWGNDAQVYKLTNTIPPGRYTVAYHMTASKATLDETRKALLSERPKFIVVDNRISFPFTFAITLYNQRMALGPVSIYERPF
jgi:hypothetical protein